MTARLGVINAAMFGRESEPGEHVDWCEPDYLNADTFRALLGDVAAYAADNPHMIVFVLPGIAS